jgi:hypothetical protein
MSGYGICCWSLLIQLQSYSAQSGQADMSGVMLALLSGEVLSPLNKAMTFQVNAQGVH